MADKYPTSQPKGGTSSEQDAAYERLLRYRKIAEDERDEARTDLEAAKAEIVRLKQSSGSDRHLIDAALTDCERMRLALTRIGRNPPSSSVVRLICADALLISPEELDRKEIP